MGMTRRQQPTALGAALAFVVLAGAILWALITLAITAAAKASTETPTTYVGCKVTLRVENATTQLEATGLLTVWDTQPGHEYAEMYGTVDQHGTGKLRVETTAPPLDLTLISCPWRRRSSDLIGPERSEGPPFAPARHAQPPQRGHAEDTPAQSDNLGDSSPPEPVAHGPRRRLSTGGAPRYGHDRTTRVAPVLAPDGFSDGGDRADR